jgi:hypothetical protein
MGGAAVSRTPYRPAALAAAVRLNGLGENIHLLFNEPWPVSFAFHENLSLLSRKNIMIIEK